MWPFWGASTPVPLSSPPALLRRARRSRSRRRAPRRRHARFQEIIELHCISFLKVSAACGYCEARSARSLALAMHPATYRRRPREWKVPRLPRRKSSLQQVCRNLQTLVYLMVHCLLLAPRRAQQACGTTKLHRAVVSTATALAPGAACARGWPRYRKRGDSNDECVCITFHHAPSHPPLSQLDQTKEVGNPSTPNAPSCQDGATGALC